MAYRFSKHYTRDEARALLPQVREWLDRLEQLREQLLLDDQRLQGLLQPGADTGGELVNNWARDLAGIQNVLLEFDRREILIKDPDRGLLDFPAIIAGREVFLCWEKDEDDIEFWHDIDAGYAGRERL